MGSPTKTPIVVSATNQSTKVTLRDGQETTLEKHYTPWIFTAKITQNILVT